MTKRNALLGTIALLWLAVSMTMSHLRGVSMAGNIGGHLIGIGLCVAVAVITTNGERT